MEYRPKPVTVSVQNLLSSAEKGKELTASASENRAAISPSEPVGSATPSHAFSVASGKDTAAVNFPSEVHAAAPDHRADAVSADAHRGVGVNFPSEVHAAAPDLRADAVSADAHRGVAAVGLADGSESSTFAMLSSFAAKPSNSLVGISNLNLDIQLSVPADLLAVCPAIAASIPTSNFCNLDIVGNIPNSLADCHAHFSAPPLACTSRMAFDDLQNSPISVAIDSVTTMQNAEPMNSVSAMETADLDTIVQHAASLVSTVVVADAANASLVTDSAPSLNTVLNPNAPLFNPQTLPYATLPKSFADALLGETHPQNVSKEPLFFAVKSAEFPTFQMPQFAEFYTSSSFIPPDETTSSFPRDDIYTFSDGDDVPRWPESRDLIFASLKSFYKNLQAKFSMHRRFFRCPKHRKRWKQRAPISSSDPALSSIVPPPLNALTFHGPNPYAVQPDDNDAVEYESEWHTESSDAENSFDFSIPLSSEAALMALEYEDFSLSPPRRRKYNKRFRDLPPPLPTRRTQP